MAYRNPKHDRRHAVDPRLASRTAQPTRTDIARALAQRLVERLAEAGVLAHHRCRLGDEKKPKAPLTNLLAVPGLMAAFVRGRGRHRAYQRAKEAAPL